jgi:hypothetical protein
MKVFKIASRAKKFESIFLGLGQIIGFLVILIIVIATLDLNKIAELSVIMFNDYRFYLSIILEFTVIWVVKENFARNKNDITSVKMANFSTILTVPILGYFFTDLMGYSDTVIANFTNVNEFILVMTLMLILYSLLLIVRIKRIQIDNPLLILSLIITAPLAVFLAFKNMQVFESSYLFFLYITAFNALVFFIFSVKNDNIKKEDIGKNKRNFYSIIVANILVYSIIPIIGVILAAEVFTMLKRVYQIKIAIFFDIQSKKQKYEEIISRKESIILILILILAVYFQMKTMI